MRRFGNAAYNHHRQLAWSRAPHSRTRTRRAGREETDLGLTPDLEGRRGRDGIVGPVVEVHVKVRDRFGKAGRRAHLLGGGRWSR